MGKSSRLIKANIRNKSVFNYTLQLGPDGNIKILDENGKPLKDQGTRKSPRIKRVLNVRTLTIIEAEGSHWIYVKPPGFWYQLS